MIQSVFFILFSNIFTSLKSHLAYLFGNDPHKKNNNGCCKKKSAHVGEPSRGKISINIIDKADEKNNKTYRKKNPER